MEDDSEPEAMSSSATKASYEGSQVRENTQKERRKKEKKKNCELKTVLLSSSVTRGGN